MTQVHLESVSMGKGFVHWRVNLPPFKRRPRTLQKQYASLEEACSAVKGHYLREEVEPATADLIEKQDPEGTWGSARVGQPTKS